MESEPQETTTTEKQAESMQQQTLKITESFEKLSKERQQQMRAKWPDIFAQMKGSEFEKDFDGAFMFVICLGKTYIKEAAEAQLEQQSRAVDVQYQRIHDLFLEKQQEQYQQHKEDLGALHEELEQIRLDQEGRVRKQLQQKFMALMSQWQEDHEKQVKGLHEELDKVYKDLKETKRQLREAVKDPLQALTNLDTLKSALEQEAKNDKFESLD